MGSSSSVLVHKVLQQVYAIKPRSMLDVGYGTGKWGYLIREKAELRKGRKRKDFVLRIDGVDIENRWHTPVHDYIYDDLFHEDIRKWEPKRTYDMILMGDILEHLTKTEGMAVLKKYLKKCRYLILSSPFGFISSLPADERLKEEYPYEKHKSEWTYADLKNEGHRVMNVVIENPNFMMVLRGDLQNMHDVDEVERNE